MPEWCNIYGEKKGSGQYEITEYNRKTNSKIQKISCKSDATIEKYIRDVTAFVKWLGGEIPRKERVIQYKERLIAQYKTASVNSILPSLNMFFEYADWHKMKVKILKTQRKIFADKSKELTKTEYERLLTAAKDRKNEKLYYLIQTIASTGLLVSEIKFITFEAIKRR